MSPSTSPYTAGMRVRVTQQIPRLDRVKGDGGTVTTIVEGVVVGFTQQKTGSWYAHAKDHKVWLDRLELKKDDGEQVVLNLDQYSSVEILDSSDRKAS